MIDFRGFLLGVSAFNSPGNRDQKFKTAFHLHDFDEYNFISHEDLFKYLNCITAGGLSSLEIDEIVENVFSEISSDGKEDTISFIDFQRVIAPTEFQSKLYLPF